MTSMISSASPKHKASLLDTRVLIEGKDIALLGYGSMVQNCVMGHSFLAKLRIEIDSLCCDDNKEDNEMSSAEGFGDPKLVPRVVKLDWLRYDIFLRMLVTNYRTFLIKGFAVQICLGCVMFF
ncbi:hypothetical protein RJT34_02355 [Clitoria ternatea]|uniref:Uncharacterized protein n=1 Tax=Clitoria ternatea TaxID=43366 RepID=A0AAN9Q0W5_CLITE